MPYDRHQRRGLPRTLDALVRQFLVRFQFHRKRKGVLSFRGEGVVRNEDELSPLHGQMDASVSPGIHPDYAVRVRHVRWTSPDDIGNRVGVRNGCAS